MRQAPMHFYSRVSDTVLLDCRHLPITRLFVFSNSLFTVSEFHFDLFMLPFR